MTPSVPMDFASPTVSRCGPKLLICIGQQLDFRIGLVDISSAFAQSALVPVSERIIVLQPPYIELPWKNVIDPSFIAQHPPKFGLITLRPLYGTSCAPLRWFSTIIARFEEKSWMQLESDACMFRLDRAGQISGLAAIHVDDILCSADALGRISFEDVISVFGHTPMEYLSGGNQLVYLGLDVGGNPDGSVYLSQETIATEKLDSIPDIDMGGTLDKPSEVARRRALCKQITGEIDLAPANAAGFFPKTVVTCL